MHASELYRAVARATGETITTIHRRGFSLVEEDAIDLLDEVSFGPNVVDWDELEVRRIQLQHEDGNNVPFAA
ncbi:hypothetical protein [Bremerella sp.]|uniref:hypothetical protein n=1 Tax=Bremerella sp. TaxID=2795602 RepID=UPI00391C99FD